MPFTAVAASFGVDQFRVVAEVLSEAGSELRHYVLSRSMRPRSDPDAGLLDASFAILRSIPHNATIIFPDSSESVADTISGLSPDIFICFGYNWIVPPRLLRLPRFGVLNIHFSALPKYRGASPVQWAIRNGDRDFQVTVHRMTEEVDAGPIFATSAPIALPDDVSPATLWEATRPAVKETLGRALHAVMAGETGRQQDEKEATYAPLPDETWRELSLEMTRVEFHNRFRALRYMNWKPSSISMGTQWICPLETSLSNKPSARQLDLLDGKLYVTAWEPDHA